MLFASISHKGYVRENNEDTVYVPATCEQEPLIIVADGIGGLNAGEVASSEAVKSIVEYLSQEKAKMLTPERRLDESVKAANLHVYLKSRKKQYFGMGTTLTLVLLEDNIYYIAHVGDCRAYKINQTEIKLLTEDHTLVAELVRRGGITRQQAENHPQRNVITRSLGTEILVEPDILSGTFPKSEALLACSDGLTQHVSPNEIFMAFKDCKKEKDYGQMLERLLTLALKRGGCDNISIAMAVNI